MKHFFVGLLVIILAAQTAWAGRTPLQTIARDPYVSALLLNADTGETLFAENTDAPVYPASALKLMTLLIILERIEQGTMQLTDMVQVTVEAYRMGGSQVYLDPKEQFSVEELLYALMVQSANDAAVALASHVAGSKESFVALMNQKAKELGMKNTRFYSVHGLPPSDGQQVDVTTAHDFGILCLALSKRPEVFTYTGTKVRDFRGGEFIMRNHNHLLGEVDGCDGFKTGYFKKAGFSIAATAKRNGVRIIAIVMGSKDRKVRDAKAKELLARGFAMVPARPEPVLTATQPKPGQLQATDPGTSDAGDTVSIIEKTEEATDGGGGWTKIFAGIGFGFAIVAGSIFIVWKKRNRGTVKYHRRR